MSAAQPIPEIDRAADIVCAHFGIPPQALLNHQAKGGERLKYARRLLWIHLHDNGISISGIAKAFSRTTNSIQRSIREARIQMMPEDQALLSTLPQLPTKTP
jgi:hypothetical protein